MPRASELVNFCCSAAYSRSFRADDRDSGKVDLQSDVRCTAANSVSSAGMLSMPQTVTDSDDDTSDLDLIIKIDKFLEDYTSEGEEILENNNNHNNEIELNNNNILDRFNTENLIINDVTLPGPNEIEFVRKESSVFELLEDNEKIGAYEHNQCKNNWNVFYKPFSLSEKKNNILQESSGPEIVCDNIAPNDITNSQNDIDNFSFSTEQMNTVPKEQFCEALFDGLANEIICTNNEFQNSFSFSYNTNEFQDPVNVNENILFSNTNSGYHKLQKSKTKKKSNNTRTFLQFPKANPEYLVVEDHKKKKENSKQSEIEEGTPNSKKNEASSKKSLLTYKQNYCNRNHNHNQCNKWQQRNSSIISQKNNKMLKNTSQEFPSVTPNDLANSKTKFINANLQPKRPVFKKFNKISNFARDFTWHKGKSNFGWSTECPTLPIQLENFNDPKQAQSIDEDNIHIIPPVCSNSTIPHQVPTKFPNIEERSQLPHDPSSLKTLSQQSFEFSNFEKPNNISPDLFNFNDQNQTSSTFSDLKKPYQNFVHQNEKNILLQDYNSIHDNKKTTDFHCNDSIKVSQNQFQQHHIIKDYLCPMSLVGCTIKFSSKKLANTSIREDIITLLNLHGKIENSWWTPDDMFYATFSTRNVAQHVFNLYPKNMASSY